MMTTAERKVAQAYAQMLRDLFGCGCPAGWGCPSCDPYHLAPRAVRRFDVRYSTLDDLLGGASRARQGA